MASWRRKTCTLPGEASSTRTCEGLIVIVTIRDSLPSITRKIIISFILDIIMFYLDFRWSFPTFDGAQADRDCWLNCYFLEGGN